MARTPEVAGGLLRGIVEFAIDGGAGFLGARAVAARRLGESADRESAITALVTQHITLASAQGFVTSVGGLVTLDVEPPLVSGQRVRVIVGPSAIDYQPPLTQPPTVQASFTVQLPPEVGAGDHPLRVEVDGASSALVDPAPADPVQVPSPYVQVS